MNRFKIFGLLFVLALGAVAAPPAPAAAQIHASVNVSFFYDSLAPYGQWVNNPSYGYVWRPTRVSTGWRPYMNGRWLYTDVGWSFDSYEPWGWATFHYGRWLFDPYYGWIWVPGTQWSPAWVDFQIGDGWIGWAPLPPGVSVDASYGRSRYRSRIDPRGYCFVENRRFLDSRVDRYVAPWDRNTRYLRQSRDATRFSSFGGVAVNRGLPVETVERSIRRAVPRVPIVDVASYRDISSRRNRGFAVYRPSVRARADHRPAVVSRPIAPRRAPVVDRGGRVRVQVGASRPTYRPPARSITSRPTQRVTSRVTERRTVSTQRVASPPQRRVASPRAVQGRPRHQDVRVRNTRSTIVTRSPHQVVRRQVTSERRSVVTPRASRRVVERTVQQRQQVQRPQAQRRHAPPPKKLHGNGRPPG